MRRVLLGMSLFLTLATVTSVARADTFFTQLGEINSPSGGPSNFATWSDTGNGASYVNLQSNASNVPFVGVGAYRLGDTSNGDGGFSTPSPGAGLGYVAVFAMKGLSSQSGATIGGTATIGAAQIYSMDTSTFNTGTPASWTTGTLVATYSLATPENITKGNVDAYGTPFLAAQVNTFTANLTAGQQQQGRILFDETIKGANFINATTFDPFGLGNVLKEQLFATFSEDIDLSGNLPAYLSLDATDLVAIDSLVTALLGAGNTFTGVGTYNPTNPISSGDFAAVLTDVSLIPGVQFERQVVPEPASLVIWGSLTALGAVAYRRRKAVKA